MLNVVFIFSRLVIGVKGIYVYDLKPMELVSLSINLHELIEIL